MTDILATWLDDDQPKSAVIGREAGHVTHRACFGHQFALVTRSVSLHRPLRFSMRHYINHLCRHSQPIRSLVLPMYIVSHSRTFQLNRYRFSCKTVSQWRSYRGGRGAIAPSGSILALKQHTFSYVASNVKLFFGQKCFDFEILAPPPRKVSPPWKISDYATGRVYLRIIVVYAGLSANL